MKKDDFAENRIIKFHFMDEWVFELRTWGKYDLTVQLSCHSTKLCFNSFLMGMPQKNRIHHTIQKIYIKILPFVLHNYEWSKKNHVYLYSFSVFY